MTSAKVFVDDAVMGRLPQVCAKDGTPTGSRLRIVTEVGRSTRFGILWLLLLAGPPGWIVVALLYAWDPGERLAVEVPLSDPSYDRFTQARRQRRLGSACAVAAVALAFVLIFWNGGGPPAAVLMFGAIFGAAASYVAADRRLTKASIGVDLDASRRWVTLRRVHPDFAAARRDQVSSHGPA